MIIPQHVEPEKKRGCRLGIVFYSVFMFLALALTIVSIPLDQFRPKGEDMIGNTGCLTLWGYKPKCYEKVYLSRPDTFLLCSSRSTRFKMASICVMVSAVLMFIAFVLGLVQICCCKCLFQWVCLVLNIGAAVTGALTVVEMADAYYNHIGSLNTTTCNALQKDFKYGGGFAVLTAGFGLNIIAVFFLLKS